MKRVQSKAASSGRYCERVCLYTVSQAGTCQGGRVIDSVWCLYDKKRDKTNGFYRRHCM